MLLTGRSSVQCQSWMSTNGKGTSVHLAPLDILKRQYDALPSRKLLAFQSQFLEEMPTMQLHLFGSVGYMITDPRNVESLVSTRFDGESVKSDIKVMLPVVKQIY